MNLEKRQKFFDCDYTYVSREHSGEMGNHRLKTVCMCLYKVSKTATHPTESRIVAIKKLR